jgi:hypothetical protein
VADTPPAGACMALFLLAADCEWAHAAALVCMHAPALAAAQSCALCNASTGEHLALALHTGMVWRACNGLARLQRSGALAAVWRARQWPLGLQLLQGASSPLQAA